ncbi:class I SAM-dependent methyltransferase [Acidisphaera sp. L21]|uniref:class I SAM-dependent methyltransferase n=1 Tax=Acidisphaera sp. L21 TaxID=1641851 RepID=UPI00131B5751|nr:SAM-dependent methyltransferase [Acidisphaera sp. L21]
MERLDEFMARANALYYASHDPFADFTTAPEISQAFGEVLGAWAAITWEALGRPDKVILAEAGPGRGTLMADAIRTIARVAPAFHAALRLHLVETSPRLRAIQAAKLPGATWHDRIEDLPPGPIILLANEFLDALPIRQFVLNDGQWTERHVAGGAWVEQSCPPPANLTATAPGLYETLDPALAQHIGDRLRAAPGVALFMDYGPYASGPGDSLQALRDGKFCDPLAEPGSADLTAHVDFAAFARASALPAHGPLAQGKFLTRLGLFARINRLAQTVPPRAALRLTEAGRRLAEPDRMGALFKALALTSPGLPTPAGFEA